MDKWFFFFCEWQSNFWTWHFLITNCHFEQENTFTPLYFFSFVLNVCLHLFSNSHFDDGSMTTLSFGDRNKNSTNFTYRCISLSQTWIWRNAPCRLLCCTLHGLLIGVLCSHMVENFSGAVLSPFEQAINNQSRPTKTARHSQLKYSASLLT